MSMFSLPISCLTTSNLSWFMDLRFQVPMQYCSLQHQTLLPTPITSTTGCCFCFGSISSFFLELVFHWSSVAYCAPTDLGSSSFSVLSFYISILFMGFSILKWFAIPFSRGPHFVRFQILKHDAVKVLYSICQKIWKTQQWPQDWERSVFIPIPKKGNAKECSNYCTIALISHASKVMLKFFQPGFNSTWTVNFQMFKLDLEKAEEPEIKLPTSAGSLKKQENFWKTSISALLTMLKPLTVWIPINCENSERDGNTGPPDLPLEKSVCRSGSNS